MYEINVKIDSLDINLLSLSVILYRSVHMVVARTINQKFANSTAHEAMHPRFGQGQLINR